MNAVLTRLDNRHLRDVHRIAPHKAARRENTAREDEGLLLTAWDLVEVDEVDSDGNTMVLRVVTEDGICVAVPGEGETDAPTMMKSTVRMMVAIGTEWHGKPGADDEDVISTGDIKKAFLQGYQFSQEEMRDKPKYVQA